MARFIAEDTYGATQGPTFEEVLRSAKQLSPSQKLRLIKAIVPNLEETRQRAKEGGKPMRSLYGLWQDLGVRISAEEIDAARREMWENFRREGK